jgi:TP901 family phage tail tape measure protein
MRLSNQIPLTAVQLTDIAAAAGQAGIAFNELVPFTRDAAQMAVAFDITAMQAGQSMAVLRNIFGLTQEGVVGLGDSVNALSNQMASAAPDMLNVLQRVGGTGRAIGMTAEQIVNFTPYLHTGTVAGSGTVAHSQPNHIVASYPSLFDGGAVDVVVSVELTTQTPGPHEYGPTQRYRVALQINRDAL